MTLRVLLCKLANALRYSSNLPVRFVLAATSVLYAVTLLAAGPSIYSSEYFSYMLKAAPKHEWAALFFANGVLLTWRMIAYESKVGWSRVVNSMTFGIYAALLWLSSFELGFFWPSNSSEFVLCIMAFWATLRTDYTPSDRSNA